jgi:hypothetical protein
MYKLLSVEESIATRILKLINLNTSTIDLCFDDSSVTSFKNFNFMEINEVYDCKIYLFGEIDDSGEKLTYIRDITIGNRDVSEVSNKKGDIYYIDKISTSEFSSKEKLLIYKYTRKDIIQVNDIIHPDFE